MNNKPMLRTLQATNELIYFQVNNRNYDPSDMISRLQSYAGQVLKCARKDKTEHIGHYLVMSLSWAFAFANHMDIDVQAELWRRFPGVCPYCKSIPCSCNVRRESRAQEFESVGIEPTSSLGLQEMLREIYPNNTLKDSAAHLAEEVIELSQAFQFYRGKHELVMFNDILEELVDVVTNLFAVSSTVKIDISEEFRVAFMGGCYRCHNTPCKCDFVTDKGPSIR